MNNKVKNIPILILAAGSSSRLGEPKQLLNLHGKTLLQKAIETALKVSTEVFVVLGANKKIIEPTISEYSIQVIFNKDWEEGMSSSIRSGMDFLNKKKHEGVLIMLCDQPFVNVLLLKNLISIFHQTKPSIVASEYNKKLGVPALFDVSFFEKLKKLKGKNGAKKLIINNLGEVKKVIFEKGGVDVDTQEDWTRLKNSNLFKNEK